MHWTFVQIFRMPSEWILRTMAPLWEWNGWSRVNNWVHSSSLSTLVKCEMSYKYILNSWCGCWLLLVLQTGFFLILFCVPPQGLLQGCNEIGATYLFQTDKHYDVNYDTGDKSIQCGRHQDVFKLWLMWKAKVFLCNTRVTHVKTASDFLLMMGTSFSMGILFFLSLSLLDKICTNVFERLVGQPVKQWWRSVFFEAALQVSITRAQTTKSNGILSMGKLKKIMISFVQQDNLHTVVE